jgi:hypothetical protein
MVKRNYSNRAESSTTQKKKKVRSNKWDNNSKTSTSNTIEFEHEEKIIGLKEKSWN